jgi:hypothetical protein
MYSVVSGEFSVPCFEYGCVSSGSAEGVELLDHLNYHQLLQEIAVHLQRCNKNWKSVLSY